MIDFPDINDFEWDLGNRVKNVFKHRVENNECEECFFNPKRFFFEDKEHSKDKEQRWMWILFSKTINGRALTVIFTTRKDKFRVISARDMSKKERSLYEKRIENSKI